MKRLIDLIKSVSDKAAVIIAAALCAFFYLIYTDTAGIMRGGRIAVVNVCLFVFLVFICLACLRSWNEKIVMSAVLGVMMLLFFYIMMPIYVPDEKHHFYRAFEISCGHMVSAHVTDYGRGGNILPAAIRDTLNINALIDWNALEVIGFGNTALYSPVSYFPQAVGIFAARLFTKRVAVIFYAGRLASLIVNFILCSLSLKLIPFGRRLLFTLMLLPMSIHEMVSLSPDGFTLSVAFFMFSFALYLAYEKENVDKRDIMVFSVFSVVMSQLKIVYIVIVLLVFLIPQEKMGSSHRRKAVRPAIVLLSAALNLVWLAVSSDFLYEFNEGVNPSEQSVFIVTHIGKFASIVARTILIYGGNWMRMLVGQLLGQADISVSLFTWLWLIIVLVYETCSVFDIKNEIGNNVKLIMSGVFLLGCALICASLYVQWTPLKNYIIDGIQGRYFLPLMPELCFLTAISRKQAVFNDISVEAGVEKRSNYLYLIFWLLDSMALMDIVKAIQ